MSVVYILKPVHSEVYKIGQTTNLERRIKTLEARYAFRLEFVYSVEIFDSFSVEQRLHSQLNSWHLGSDWFALDAVILSRVISWLEMEK